MSLPNTSTLRNNFFFFLRTLFKSNFLETSIFLINKQDSKLCSIKKLSFLNRTNNLR